MKSQKQSGERELSRMVRHERLLAKAIRRAAFPAKAKYATAVLAAVKEWR